MNIIQHPIKPEKQKAWHWRMHQYFTKQASNVVAEYIMHYSKEGDTILDPFGGTGVTAIEALRLKRKVIIVDINPLACFLVRQTCQPTDIILFKQAFTELSAKVERSIELFYAASNEELAKETVAHWFPKNIPLPKNSDFAQVEDLFTPRQLHAYALIFAEIQAIENFDIREMMKYVFTATMAKVNLGYLQNDRGLEGGASSILVTYRYHKPKQLVELNVWKNFARKFGYIVQGKEKWNALTQQINISENLRVINGSALELNQFIDENSIDYIYTDPPYGGNIAYLDLSTMWNAWLGFPVTTEMRAAEIIEGGDLEKTSADYTTLFAKSFEAMGNVLKKDGWLSCVFAHKKLEYWNVIIDSCEENGMEFKGSVYQPTNNSSMHYKKNPATVLCSQRIANFQKTFIKSQRSKPDDLQKFILNEMERTCIEQGGASIDQIYQNVLDQLLRTESMGVAKKKGYLALEKWLEDDTLFVHEADTAIYYVKQATDEQNKHVKQYLKQRDELKIYLREMLKRNGAMTLDNIHQEVFEIFKEDKRFPLKTGLFDLLHEVASKNDKTGRWTLKTEPAVQNLLFSNPIIFDKLVKIQSDGHDHAEVIFRLVQIGKYLGFNSWIGKKEQATDSFQGQKFAELSLLKLPLTVVSYAQKEKIQQIDVIWFDQLNIPRYAFEVEESTSIVSGLDRFKYLLEIHHDLAQHLFIIAPKSRRKKLQETFTTSTYVGHPLYMENKVRFVFKEDLINFYDKHVNQDFAEMDLRVLSN